MMNRHLKSWMREVSGRMQKVEMKLVQTSHYDGYWDALTSEMARHTFMWIGLMIFIAIILAVVLIRFGTNEVVLAVATMALTMDIILVMFVILKALTFHDAVGEGYYQSEVYVVKEVEELEESVDGTHSKVAYTLHDGTKFIMQDEDMFSAGDSVRFESERQMVWGHTLKKKYFDVPEDTSLKYRSFTVKKVGGAG